MNNDNKNSFYQEGDDNLLGGFVNSNKAKQLLQCKNTKLYYLRRDSELVFSKIGREIFYEIKSIQALLTRNKNVG